jgi:hypothetical protein
MYCSIDFTSSWPLQGLTSVAVQNEGVSEIDDTEAALKPGEAHKDEFSTSKHLLNKFLAKGANPRTAVARSADTHALNSNAVMLRASMNRSQCTTSMADDADGGISAEAADSLDDSCNAETESRASSSQPDSQPADARALQTQEPRCQLLTEPVWVPANQIRNPVYKWHNDFLSVRHRGREQMQVWCHSCYQIGDRSNPITRLVAHASMR